MTNDTEPVQAAAPVQGAASAGGTEVAAATADAAQPAGGGGAARRRRRAGIVGQIVGVLGIGVCVVLIVASLLGRGWAIGKVDTVEGALDAAVAKTLPLLDASGAKVTQVAQGVAAVADTADQLATEPNARLELLQPLFDRLSAASAAYLDFRETYAAIREQAVSTIDRLNTIDRIVPGISIPQGPIDALAAIDAKAQQLDAKMVALINAGSTGPTALNTAAAAIADQARAVEEALNGLAAGLATVEAGMGTLRGEIASAASTIRTAITIGTLGMVLLLVYLAFLHWVLFRTSRAARRGPATA